MQWTLQHCFKFNFNCLNIRNCPNCLGSKKERIKMLNFIWPSVGILPLFKYFRIVYDISGSLIIPSWNNRRQEYRQQWGTKKRKKNFSKVRNGRPADTKGIRVSTDTLVHVGPSRDFVPTVVGDADSAGDSLCWFQGGHPEERSRKRNEAKKAKNVTERMRLASRSYNMPKRR